MDPRDVKECKSNSLSSNGLPVLWNFSASPLSCSIKDVPSGWTSPKDERQIKLSLSHTSNDIYLSLRKTGPHRWLPPLLSSPSPHSPGLSLSEAARERLEVTQGWGDSEKVFSPSCSFITRVVTLIFFSRSASVLAPKRCRTYKIDLLR